MLKDIAERRLISQQLTGSEIKSATEMVKWFGAIQAQEYAHTKWSLGIRLPNITDNDIEKELDEGSILRTHLLRPTWHLVAASDIQWILMLTAPRVKAVNATMYRQTGLDEKFFRQCNSILVRLLENNVHLTRDEIAIELSNKNIDVKGQRLAYIMMQAELDAIVCSGKRKGRQNTYALLTERVVNQTKFTRDEALLELAFRYFRSRGPATVYDFATWSGLTITDCKRGLQLLGNKLDHFILDFSVYYFLPSSRSVTHKDQMILLPVYDEIMMGYRNRDAFMQYKKLRHSNATFKYLNMLLYNGQIFGTWKRTFKAKTFEMEFDFFSYPTKHQQKLLEHAIHHFEKYTNLNAKYCLPKR